MIDDTIRLAGRQLLVGIGLVVGILVTGQMIGQALIADARVVTLSSAPPLTGQVAQTIPTTVSNPKLSDYTLKNTRYFDNRSWAVTKVIPPKGDGDSGTTVLRKVGQFYQVVLGPGTSFSSTVTTGLPSDIIQYLNSQGLIYVAN